MKPYKEYLKDTGFDFSISIPTAKVVYYAYNGPKVFGPFDTRQEALTHSKIVDSAYDQESKKIRDDIITAQTKAEQAATKAWKEDLRAEFLIRDAQFDVLYNEAYDQAHSDGHDAIYEKMSTLLDFYSAMLDA